MRDVLDLREQLLEHLDALGHHVALTIDAAGSPALVAESSCGSYVVDVSITANGELVDDVGHQLQLPGFTARR